MRSQTNLTALRELAMQTAAARVDADLNRRYRLQGREAPTLRGRLLVGIDAPEQAERLVRHADRVAERRHLPWSVVHVDTGGALDELRREPICRRHSNWPNAWVVKSSACAQEEWHAR